MQHPSDIGLLQQQHGNDESRSHVARQPEPLPQQRGEDPIKSSDPEFRSESHGNRGLQDVNGGIVVSPLVMAVDHLD